MIQLKKAMIICEDIRNISRRWRRHKPHGVEWRNWPS